jgi:hypothetical protein
VRRRGCTYRLRAPDRATVDMTGPSDEIDPKTWKRVYVATVAYGVVTIAVLWWFTAVWA